ncbi:MAG: hypothetical protein K9K67_04180 [Bacteriovoracaceae bacterium]|nr:hypothetical protein [Bacteriovoracaceae bacterium]
MSNYRTLSVFLGIFVFLNPTFAKTYYLGAGNNVKQRLELFSEDSNTFNFSATFSKFEVEKKLASPLRGDFVSVSIEGLKNAQTPGKPQLPYKSFLVKGAPKDLKVDVTFLKKHYFKGLKSLPAPLKPCRCEKSLSAYQNLYSLDATSYNQDEDRLVELVDLGDFQGERITQVVVRPVLQKLGGMTVYEDLQVVVKNPLGVRASSVSSRSNTMLVVAPRSLASGAQAFKSFKEESGFQISLFYYEDVATNANELKNFIHKEYKNSQFQYAVLMGHEGILPPLSVATSSDPQTPSDYPYFTMGGPQDVFPDVFYGRIVAATNSEVALQIEKMREYRDQSWTDNSGAKKAIGIASNEGWDPTDVVYMQRMLGPLENSLGFSSSYFFQENSSSTVKNINKAFNQGARWFNYIGHGSGTSWPSISKDEYSSSDIAGLRPGSVKPVMIDVACQNGRFSYEGRLGERFMNSQYLGKAVGTVAYFGGSVDISWDPPAIMAVAIGNELANQRTQSLYELIMKGQRYLIENYEDVEASRENLLWYHLFGDPSLQVTGY